MNENCNGKKSLMDSYEKLENRVKMMEALLDASEILLSKMERTYGNHPTPINNIFYF